MVIGIQLHISVATALIEQVVPVENSEEAGYVKKPKRGTGFWTSTWRPETQDSEWVEWCAGENYSNPYADTWHLLTPKSDTQLYVIDSHADLLHLLDLYPWESRATRIMREAGFARTTIDFEHLSKEYDGIHLTERGNAQTHLSYPHELNSWDCESTLWFRWCFSEVKRITVAKSMKQESVP